MQQPSSSEKCKKINVVVALVTLCCILLHGRCSVQQMQQGALAAERGRTTESDTPKQGQ
jgi:hypothetical protein